MLSQRLLPILIAVAVAVPACDSNDTITDPPGRLSRRIVDFSFEVTGNKPSTFGWYIPGDSTTAGVVVGAPEGGGSYSLWLEAVWLPPVFSETRIPAIAGTHRYDLSFYARTQGVARGGSGQLFMFGKDSAVAGRSITVKDTVWTRYALSDTLTAAQGDTLAIRLYAPGTEVASGRTYYDLIRLDVEE